MDKEDKKDSLISRNGAPGEALTDALFWFAVSGVARNQKLYDRLHTWSEGLYKKKQLKESMRKMEKTFLASEFCSSRPPALGVRTLELYCILNQSNYPRMCLSEFVSKNCTKLWNEAAKRKGKVPPAKEFVSRDGNVDAAAEKFAMYHFVLAAYWMSKDGTSTVEAGSDFEDGHKLLMNYMIQSVSQNVDRGNKPHRVTPIEKFFRGQVFEERRKPLLLDFIDENNLAFLGSIIESFAGTKDVLNCPFTEWDTEYLAWALSEAAEALAEQKEKMNAGLKPAQAANEALEEHLKGGTEEHVEALIRKGILKDEIAGIDWNGIRIGYAFAKISQRDRKDVFDLFIDSIPEDEDRKFVAKEEYDT